MQNVYLLSNNYIEETPFAVLVSNRVNQLIAHYGRDVVHAAYHSKIRPKPIAWDDTTVLYVHLNNLTLTFGKEMVDGMFKVIYPKTKKFKKVS